MQLRYVTTELGQGLRRNLSMHLAVILTLFISLTLVGLGALLYQQAQKAQEHWGNQLQITFFLCTAEDQDPSCSGAVTDAQKKVILDTIAENPEVADYHTESSEEAFQKVKELLGEDKFDGPNPPVTAAEMPESVWVTLKDPQEFEGVESAVVGLDGVSGKPRDLRDILQPIYSSMFWLQIGALVTALFLGVAALLLVANTIRLAAFARRKEIGIMRLVGASSLYITLPFLLEALFTAVVGVALAAATLFAFWYFAIHGRISDELKFMPWVGVDAYGWSVVVIAVLGPLLTLLPTLLLTRKHIRV